MLLLVACLLFVIWWNYVIAAAEARKRVRAPRPEVTAADCVFSDDTQKQPVAYLRVCLLGRHRDFQSSCLHVGSFELNEATASGSARRKKKRFRRGPEGSFGCFFNWML